jgi:hypothetical protein
VIFNWSEFCTIWRIEKQSWYIGLPIAVRFPRLVMLRGVLGFYTTLDKELLLFSIHTIIRTGHFHEIGESKILMFLERTG